jgi:hypothetical protein
VRANGPDFSFGGNAEFRRILKHELGHAYLFAMTKYGKDVPAFLHEAVAAYFMEVSTHTGKHSDVRKYAGPRANPGLGRMLATKNDDFINENGQSNYAWAHNFVHFMLSDPARRGLFGVMLERSFDGQPPLTGDEIRRLEPEWNRYNSGR